MTAYTTYTEDRVMDMTYGCDDHYTGYPTTDEVFMQLDIQVGYDGGEKNVDADVLCGLVHDWIISDDDNKEKIVDIFYQIKGEEVYFSTDVLGTSFDVKDADVTAAAIEAGVINFDNIVTNQKSYLPYDPAVFTDEQVLAVQEVLNGEWCGNYTMDMIRSTPAIECTMCS